MPRFLRLVVNCLLLATTLQGCRCDDAKQVSSSVGDKRAEKLLELIRQQEWRRIDSPRLLALLVDPDVEVRERAALATGRVGIQAAVQSLAGLLSDPSFDVRRNATFALRLIGLDSLESNATVRAAIVGRLPREKHPVARRELILSLGWVGDARDLPRLTQMLDGAYVDEAVIAIGLLGYRKTFDNTASAAKAIAALTPLVGEGSARRQVITAWAIARLGGTRAQASVRKLRALADLSDRRGTLISQARAWAIRAITVAAGAESEIEWLSKRAADPDVGVQVEAIAALGRAGIWGAVKLTVKLQQLWRSICSSHFRLTGRRLRAMLVGLKTLRQHAKLATVQRFARNILDLSDASDATVRYSPIEAHSVDLVHCAAAQLLDLSIGRAEHTAICGTARAADVTQSMRMGFSAEVIGLMQRPAQWKISLLRRYLTAKDPAVRVRAVDSLGSISGPEIELPLASALADKNLAVVGAAGEVAAKRAQFLSAREISPLLNRRLAGLKPFAAPDTACALVRALGKLGAQIPTALMSNPARAVQRCVLEALRKKDPSIKPNKRQLSRALPDLRWASDRPPPNRAVIVTEKGEIHIELFPTETPATVANFARLAGKRFFRATRFHRLVPGFVLQGGDPSFTGWGGPGYTIPCELTPRPFSRGSVGMALAGRDTGGSQFFITLARHPHLDGRYTQFGRVVKGMEVVDRLAVGERIKDLYIP